MSWWALTAPVAVIAALLFAPGWLLLRLAGLRGLLALGGAPAISLAYLGLAGLVLDRAQIAWGWPPLLAGLLPLAGIAALCGCWVRRHVVRSGLAPGGLWSARWALGAASSRPQVTDGGSRALSGRSRAGILAGGLVLAALTFLVPYLVGLGAPDAIVQQWDAVFHANGVQLIRDTGNASVLGAMQGQYGLAAPGVYYPAVWHSVAALAPGGVALVMNASVIALAGVWLVGLAALGRALGDSVWSLAVWTPVLGSAFGLFPSRILVELSQLPLGTAIAAIPGAVALMVAASRTAPGELSLVSTARRTVTLLVLLAAMGGVALAHGGGLFSFLLVVVPIALVRLVHGVRLWWRTGRKRAAVVVGVVFGVAFLGGFALLLASPTLRAVAAYSYDTNDFVLVTVYRTLFDLPTAPVVPGLWPLAVLTVVGAVAVLRRGELARHRWLVWAGVAVLVVAAASAGGLGPLRILGGPWYSQTSRIVAVFPVVAAPLAAFGAIVVARRLHAWAAARRGSASSLVASATSPVASASASSGDERSVASSGDERPVARSGLVVRIEGARPVVLVAVVVGLAFLGTAGWYAPSKAERGGRYTLPEPIEWGTMLSAEELALVERLPQTTPPDAVILGDPANGAAFAYSIAQRAVVFPQLDPSNQSPAQRTLRFGFHQLMTEPAVCDAARELGVTHFYQDTATTADGAKVSEDWTGMTTPVTPEMLEGLEIVDAGGSATLYRLTACG